MALFIIQYILISLLIFHYSVSMNTDNFELSVFNASIQSLSSVATIMAQEKLKISLSATTPLPFLVLIHETYLKELERLTSNFPNENDSNCHRCLVCTNHNKTILGYIDIDKRIDIIKYPTPYISDIVVDQSYRRRGIAQLLLKECEHISKNWKNNELYLLAETKNHKALLLYEKIGYKPIEFEILKNCENKLKFTFNEVYGDNNRGFTFKNKNFLKSIMRFDRILFRKIF
jgi:ribosomal protein S18 acetylase RimI-like enzyme